MMDFLRNTAMQDENQTKEIDRAAIEDAVKTILTAIGEDPNREGLRQTPSRVASMYAELFTGMGQDPRTVLATRFAEKYDEVVLVKDISFSSMCEHHLLPFIGSAHVAYIPNGQVVGLSKIARVVDVIAHRPQLQERMTQEIAEILEDELKPKGVAVVLEAQHTCISIRGVKKPNAIMTTSSVLGVFRRSAAARAEVMMLINRS